MKETERPINGVEPEKSEDDIQREQLGPRGVPGGPDPAKMTPQREEEDADTSRSGTHRMRAPRPPFV